MGDRDRGNAGSEGGAGDSAESNVRVVKLHLHFMPQKILNTEEKVRQNYSTQLIPMRGEEKPYFVGTK